MSTASGTTAGYRRYSCIDWLAYELSVRERWIDCLTLFLNEARMTTVDRSYLEHLGATLRSQRKDEP
jgi:hypothetical protein